MPENNIYTTNYIHTQIKKKEIKNHGAYNISKLDKWYASQEYQVVIVTV